MSLGAQGESAGARPTELRAYQTPVEAPGGLPPGCEDNPSSIVFSSAKPGRRLLNPP